MFGAVRHFTDEMVALALVDGSHHVTELTERDTLHTETRTNPVSIPSGQASCIRHHHHRTRCTARAPVSKHMCTAGMYAQLARALRTFPEPEGITLSW